MAKHFMYDVLISYRRSDQEIAKRLQRELESLGLKVWRDERLNDDAAAAGYDHKIVEALDLSAKVIVLWSRAALQSDWVRGEAKRAHQQHKYIGILLEPVELLPPFNMGHALKLASIQQDPNLLLRALGANEIEGRPGQWALFPAHVDISKMPATYAQKLYGRGREMDALVKAWDGGFTRVFAFDAMGGAGKTALVYHFVQELKAWGWRGARRVYAWSFYSQGSNEDRQTGADDFFKAAFQFFSDDKIKPPTDPREKGVQLARLVQESRSLLILDGLEPLQYATGRAGRQDRGAVGGIKDPGIKALLSILADENEGLVIVTTRIELADLRGNAGVVFEPLDRLPLMDAIDLIRDLGVEPAYPPAKFKMPPDAAFAALVPSWQPPATYVAPVGDDRAALPARVARQLVEAVEELKGHALALTLVATYLVEHHEGDIRAVGDLPPLANLDPNAPERDPYRVMHAIEIALARRIDEQGKTRTPAGILAGRELALLFFLGLFDRPADVELLKVVFPKEGALEPAAEDLALAATDISGVVDDPKLPEAERAHRRAERERRKEELSTIFDARMRVLTRRLFGAMHGISEGELRSALSDLARRGLVAKLDEDVPWTRASLDCHPLVREYFGSRVGGDRTGEGALDLAAFQAAHGRLYDHYRYAGLPQAFGEPVAYGVLALRAAYEKDHYPRLKQGFLNGSLSDDLRSQTPPSIARLRPEHLLTAFALVDGPDWPDAKAAFLPEDEAGMAPLFSGIAHGCAAGRQTEAWSEAYWPRISRGNYNFATRQLGLYGQTLAAIASFFEVPFTEPSGNLLPGDQALVLNAAGYFLRALGRLEDAVAPFRSNLRMRVEQEIWISAAIAAGNLCELLLTLGRLSGEDGAVAAGRQAVGFGDRAGNAFQRMADRQKYGPALLAAGEIANAEGLFREAETLQKAHQPEHAQLYSTAGFRYCDLLLDRGRVGEAAERYRWFVGVRQRGDPILDFALEELTRARAALAQQAPLPVGVAREKRAEHFATLTAPALAALRRANSEDDLPDGLLTHIEALWLAGDLDGVDEHLREAESIAQRGPMPLFAAEACLLRARIALSQDNLAAAREKANAAADLIAKHGYRRAAPEHAVLAAEIAAAAKAPDLAARLEKAIVAVRGTPYKDERTGILIDGGWWGLWPRLDALLPAGHPERAGLEAVRAAYNTERDAYLAKEAADLDAKLAKDWEEEDRALADPAFRRKLSEALVASGYKPLDATPVAEQRRDARQYLKMKREASGRTSGDGQEMPDVPDALLDQILGDPKARGALEHLLREAGVETPLDQMPRERQRAAVAAMMAAMRRREGGGKDDEADDDGQDIPDSLVRQIFADPDAQGLLRDAMRRNNLAGAPSDLPFRNQRAIVAALMQAGAVSVGRSPSATPPPEPPRAPPPAPPVGRGTRRPWWRPFGRKH